MVTGWEEGGEGTVREFGMDVYTLLYLKWRTSKELLHSAVAWLGGASGEKGYMDVSTRCVAESLCVHLKLSQHC